MFEKRGFVEPRAAKALVLASALGDAERDQEWATFLCACAQSGVSEPCVVQEAAEADFVFLATGGVEHLLLRALAQGAPRAVYAPRLTNAYAALCEVRAHEAAQGRSLMIFGERALDLAAWIEVSQARGRIAAARLVSFGQPSAWLVASSPEPSLLQERLGLRAQHVAWEDLGWEECACGVELLDAWGKYAQCGVNSDRFHRCVQLSQALLHYAQREHCDCIMAGCFTLLSEHVSACLALSDLLDNHILAVCENDWCSAVAMLIADYVGMCPSPPWMANLVDKRGDCVEFQHCTIAKRSVGNGKLLTHFESQDAAALGGEYLGEEVCVMRVDARLRQMFVSRAKVIERSINLKGCRTALRLQLERELGVALGNHHIILPVAQTERLEAFADLAQMQLC